MKRWFVVCCLILWLAAPMAGQEKMTQEKPTEEKAEKKDKFAELTKDAEKLSGLFSFYRKKDKVYLELSPEQFNKPFICGVTLESGIGEQGLYSTMTLSEFVFVFRRQGDRIHVVQRNLYFRTSEKHPFRKVVERSFSDSIITSAKVEAEHADRKSVLVDLDSLLLIDLPAFSNWLNSAFGTSYRLDREHSQIVTVKPFSGNVEVEVDYTFRSDRPSASETLPDPRSLRLRVHYSFAQLPQNNYRPRLADTRVGYFVVAFKDFTDDNRRTAFVRYICRWHLEKSDPKAPISPPKQPIVFWIENTTPHEYRQAIREGILMWNKAFEQAGFSNAIEVREMPDDADWDPADMRFNVIRWMLSHDASFAVGPSRVNPLTGQILDADIVIEANFVRYIKQEWRLLVNPASARFKLFPDPYDVLDEPAWQPNVETLRHFAASSSRQFALCEYGAGLARQAALGALALWLQTEQPKTYEPPEDYVRAAICELVAHEVGHTLGLRHNFHGSSLLLPDALHNPELTKRIGLSSSVMDYLPVNIAPPGKKQGEYWSSAVGPYDCWAIEYGYIPIPNAETPEDELPILRKIASRAPQPELAYGTDEDTWGVGFDLDPTIVRWDLSNDPMEWAKGQLELVQHLLSKLEKKFPRKGEGYWDLRDAFSLLLGHHSYSCFLIARYIGGQFMHRDFPDDPKGRLPFVPVSAEKQRQALALLERYLFAPDAFKFSPSLLNKLAIENWWHWGTDPFSVDRPDYPLHRQILAMQRRALNRLLHPTLMARILDAEVKTDKPFRLSELFDRLTATIWAEVLDEKAQPINSVRRNLQRVHLQMLTQLLLDPPSGTPEDARTFSRKELTKLQKYVQKALTQITDATTKAHLEETLARIQRSLQASIQLPPYKP